ncbi:hypothetical protein LMG19083_04980 [Ralstonia psammae]|uniref:Transmembrane protein n=1 Tax=Ralstonia psammae TaxID=3058598 RepID=A0ABM9JZV0_9RALS|nr:hypothetical protein LMG19083_04980 [Ralstonia sp. LMG 19083]
MLCFLVLGLVSVVHPLFHPLPGTKQGWTKPSQKKPKKQLHI